MPTRETGLSRLREIGVSGALAQARSERGKAHILPCRLAYYVRWHLERVWAA
jgi:hypothetical protein